MESPCYCLKHPDLHGARIEKENRYGLGSVHYLRDLGDCIKLVKALGTTLGGSEMFDDGVVLVGGGLLAIEVAAAIVTYFP